VPRPTSCSSDPVAVVGTLAGERLLRRIPESVFRRVAAGLIVALGVLVFFEAAR
jgi:uncharacterized membrane protein YfcA